MSDIEEKASPEEAGVEGDLYLSTSELLDRVRGEGTITWMRGINALQVLCHATAKEHGWWGAEAADGGLCNERNFPEQTALQHTELSEVLEEYRKFGMDYERFIYTVNSSDPQVATKPEGIAVEYADLLIRVFDTCERYSIPLAEALRMKMIYNESRPYLHGGKKC